MSVKEEFKYLITEFQNKKIPEFIPRVKNIFEIPKIVSIVGFRRSGKTFFFNQLMKQLMDQGVPKKNILYINFEDDRIFDLKITDLQYLLDAFYELYPEIIDEEKYFFFDEIQVVDNWEIFVRRLYDKEKVKLFITGSSSKLLSKEIATSLRGRTITYTIFPLSFKEFLIFKDIKLEENFQYSTQRFSIMKFFEHYLTNGAFPEIVLHPDFASNLLQNYFDLFIYRDLVERFNIRNISSLRYLINFLLTNIGNLFSINKYFNAQPDHQKISRPTIMDYLSYLEEVSLIYSLKKFDYSLKVQQVNPVKIYCIDTGLRNNVAFQFSKDSGRLVENIVLLELLRQEKEVYYWKGVNEVDFIIKEKDNSFLAINVSYTDEIAERETLGLKEFNQNYSDKKISLIILTKDLHKTEEGINYIPVWKWLLT